MFVMKQPSSTSLKHNNCYLDHSYSYQSRYDCHLYIKHNFKSTILVIVTYNLVELKTQPVYKLRITEKYQGARERSEGKYRRSLKERPVLHIH